MKKLLLLLFLLLTKNAISDDSIDLLSITQTNKTHISSAWKSSWHRIKAPENPIELSSLKCPAFCDYIKTSSNDTKIPESWLLAVIKAESSFNPKAISPKGAKGLMQLMDINSKFYNIDPFNPKENIQGGSTLLAKLYQRYNDLSFTLAAYNAGPSAVDKYNGIPPYPETMAYVDTVIRYIKQFENQ